MIDEHRPRRNRSRRKKKRSFHENYSLDTATTGATADSEGRHFHLNVNTVPFILGASTEQSHNVNSNVQNVILSSLDINRKKISRFFS